MTFKRHLKTAASLTGIFILAAGAPIAAVMVAESAWRDLLPKVMTILLAAPYVVMPSAFLIQVAASAARPAAQPTKE